MMSQPNSSQAVLRWGIIATGAISTAFATDLLTPRPNAPAKHLITAIGSSSLANAQTLITKAWKDSLEPKPQGLYADYHSVYQDPNVDIVYIGTPHALHKKNCLDAIAAGKHVLCEKPFTVNRREAEEVFAAAKKKGVYVMEALWTRFLPLIDSLRDHITTKKTIGTVHRLFIDFATKRDWDALPPTARQRDPALGAGALLDVGIYPLTYASLLLGDGKLGDEHPEPKVTSTLDIVNGIDQDDVIVLRYRPEKENTPCKTAICTATLNFKGFRDFARIEGSEGIITVFGWGPSVPHGFRIKRGEHPGPFESVGEAGKEEVYEFPHPGGAMGFYTEADAVAVDIWEGRLESGVMPHCETLRVMGLMDGIRERAGLVYPQDLE